MRRCRSQLEAALDRVSAEITQQNRYLGTNLLILGAETRANELPVKMVGPLGLCIFPVILGIVLLPVVIRLFAALGTV